MTIKETEIAIKKIKDYFEKTLAEKLNLTRVSAPLFVTAESGLNDTLNGVERPVSFDIKAITQSDVQIVQSLAKWKRVALKRYDFKPGEGLYTDMNAIRRDEELDPLHSVYVDQWDWELLIEKEERNEEKLHSIVKKIFSVFKDTENFVISEFKSLKSFLPDDIFFITSEELLQLYPNLSEKQREDEIAKKYGAVFINKIGDFLSNGKKHDGRAPDYDDWSLNGDILFWYPVLNRAIELSSMGIRVDEKSLVEQLKKSNCEERLQLPYHSDIVNKKLPYTLGGGIGQSRICMFFLGKSHIGEVQSSVWDDETIIKCKENNINLL